MKYLNDSPIYRQIATDIQEKIVSGKIVDGEKLASIREYSVLYEVSALTIQRAIQYLESLNIVRTQKGVGSFVLENCQERISVRMIEEEVEDFIKRMMKRGMNGEQIIQLVKEKIRYE